MTTSTSLSDGYVPSLEFLSKMPKIEYSYSAHNGKLPVKVFIGSRWPNELLSKDIPVTVKMASRCEVWIPWEAADLETIAHEGVHVAHWALGKIGTDSKSLLEIVPTTDMSWGYSLAAVKEEAVAWLSDRFMWQFCKCVIDNDLPFKAFMPRRLMRGES